MDPITEKPQQVAEQTVKPATPPLWEWGARSVDHFEKIEQIGEGTYGQVFMAKERATGDIVALKKVRMDSEKEGFPITAIREIKILKSLNHKNIVNLKEIVTSKAHESNQNKGSIYLVFEYMDHDLTGLSERAEVIPFAADQTKCYMIQLLKGIHYCHSMKVLHRDIKGSNLLIDNNGILKLADFGLARPWAQENANELTTRVITLWYRPPELFFGSKKYGPEVDMWSVGCILAELLTGKPILCGKTEAEQVQAIFRLCGSPTETDFPEALRMDIFKSSFKPQVPLKRRVREHFGDRHRFPRITPMALDLIDKLLALDPRKRLSAQETLQHDYFWREEPRARDPSQMPKYEPSHEYPMKKRRQENKARMQESQQGGVPPGPQDYQGGGKRHMPNDQHRNRPPQGYNNGPPPQGGGQHHHGGGGERGVGGAGYGGQPSHGYGGAGGQHRGGGGGGPPHHHHSGGGSGSHHGSGGGRGGGGGGPPPYNHHRGGGSGSGGPRGPHPPAGPGGGSYNQPPGGRNQSWGSGGGVSGSSAGRNDPGAHSGQHRGPPPHGSGGYGGQRPAPHHGGGPLPQNRPPSHGGDPARHPLPYSSSQHGPNKR